MLPKIPLFNIYMFCLTTYMILVMNHQKHDYTSKHTKIYNEMKSMKKELEDIKQKMQ